jgi:hypothetical protein
MGRHLCAYGVRYVVRDRNDRRRAAAEQKSYILPEEWLSQFSSVNMGAMAALK